MLYNKEEYILRSHLGEEVLSLDPMGSEDTTINIGRSEKSFGIFTTVANNLTFIGSGKAFLDLNYLVDGVNAYVELVQKVKNPITDDWDINYRGYLDFKTRKVSGNKFTIDFIEGGFKETLEAQAREKFEIHRQESITNKPISPLVLDELTLEGREIFQMTKFYSENEEYYHRSGLWQSGNDYRISFSPFPYKRLTFTHEFVAEPYETLKDKDRWEKNIGNGIIRNVPMDIPNFPVNFDWDLKVLEVFKDDVDNFSLWVVVERYSGGVDMVFEDRLFEERLPFPFKGMEEKGNHSIILDMKEGDTYLIGLASRGQYGDFFGNGGIQINYNFSGSLTIPQDSTYERTGSPFISAFDLGNRLTEIYSGKKKFLSSILQSGKWKDLGFATGGWFRNLKKKVETTNRDGVVLETTYEEWPMAMSFDDFYKSINAVQPVGFGITSVGAKQFVRMEPIRYFFQPIVTIDLGEISELDEATAADFVFAFITTGYVKGGNYEQELGLDEFNIKSTFGSPVIKGDKKYEAISPSRGDSYAVEQARRFPYSEFAERDTPFDNDNFIIDAKLLVRSNVKSYYSVRLWPDDFERKPTGVYSADTAFNLRISPANNLVRHSTMFNASLFKFKQQKLLHVNSEGNSELLTKMADKPELKEGNDILIEDLSNPIFEAEWYNFEVPRTQKLFNALKGTTVINGEVINNYYGLVRFKYRNQSYHGYLFTAEIKNTITFKLIKAYGF